MKKALTLFLCLSVFLSCKKSDKSENKDVTLDTPEQIGNQDAPLTVIKGEFVYYGDAAVLQSRSKIYGVYVTDKMLELHKQAKQYKKAPTDMVQVEIKGRINTKKHDKILWEEKIEVVEILSVSPTKNESNNIVELGGV